MATIVLAHGWGFDHGVWNEVRARLSSAHRVETLDFGFFGAPRQPKVGDGETVIAVGHSLGACWWLAQSPIPWSRLLLINGFPRFTEAADYAPAVAPRVLARMRKSFAQQPAEVLAEFRAFCGAAPAPAGFDASRLAAGLEWLAEWDGRGVLRDRAGEIRALAGSNDPIVPAGMSRAALACLPAEHLEFADVAGHVLPLAAPALCAAWIERVATA
ncbi:alpha/beta fold hydrolase [Sulfurisoma sediminicola]|uniref:Pimeloyl-[acyl-carrier protein] methyl ester esterase n=1 Tax=Sulfurisoma sediminicola TaxID=1381557 RepID=A0A497XKU0_9PROT|nr:alpha/beta hydrolase [Sulfurisoma sediminicola]RLJ68571.1 pimeloyl-[acyl-carrier protein] methyl ester esterase [Sulfurisoma sediminicola]